MPPGPLRELAQGLRELRADTGMTYRVLARKAGYSASALSAAASGDALPTLDVVLAYAGACGGDRQEWSRRWHEVAAAERGTQEGPQSGSTDDQPDRGSAVASVGEWSPDPDAGALGPETDPILAAYGEAGRRKTVPAARLALTPAVLAVAAVAAYLALTLTSHGLTGITGGGAATHGAGSSPSSEAALQHRNGSAASLAMLGAPNWKGYCTTTGHGTAELTSNDAYGWHCADGAGIDGNAACAWTYGYSSNEAIGRIQDFYDSSSWQCWRVSRELGTPDFNGYCRATGQGAVHQTSDNAYGWTCSADNGTGDDANAVCAWTYGRGQAQVTNRFADFYDPRSWQCWA